MFDVSEVLVALVAAAFPSFLGWAAHRLSAEGRLASRIVRWGAVHAAVPDSPEREEFARHLTASLGKLNVRLRHEATVLRRWRWGVGVALYIVAVVMIVIWGNHLSLEWNLVVALSAGFAIAVAVLVTEALVVRQLVHRDDESALQVRMRERGSSGVA